MGLKLVFLIVSCVMSVLGLSRRESWWKDAEILCCAISRLPPSGSSLVSIRV